MLTSGQGPVAQGRSRTDLKQSAMPRYLTGCPGLPCTCVRHERGPIVSNSIRGWEQGQREMSGRPKA